MDRQGHTASLSGGEGEGGEGRGGRAKAREQDGCANRWLGEGVGGGRGRGRGGVQRTGG